MDEEITKQVISSIQTQTVKMVKMQGELNNVTEKFEEKHQKTTRQIKTIKCRDNQIAEQKQQYDELLTKYDELLTKYTTLSTKHKILTKKYYKGQTARVKTAKGETDEITDGKRDISSEPWEAKQRKLER